MHPKDQVVLMNDDWKPRDQAFVDIEDRGYQFGDGIYEVIRTYDGKMFMASEHVHRLERSAREIGLTLPYPRARLIGHLEELISRNGLKEGFIYVQITRGSAPRMHHFPQKLTPPQLVAYTKDAQRPVELQQNGVRAILTPDIRWLRCDIKTINLLGNVLAKEEAAKQNAYEAILHREHTVTEGSSTNVFIVQDGVLYTHPATHLILNGITRQKVIALCRKLKLDIREQPFTVAELLRADEVFITSTTNEIMPVIRINEKEIGPGIAGPFTIKLQEAFQEDIDRVAYARH